MKSKYYVVIKKNQQTLLVIDGDKVIEMMPCSTGTGVLADGYDGITHNGFYVTSDIRRSSNLGWPHPNSPRKPYGPYHLDLEALNGQETTMAIHGTDEPENLGTPVSHGCIRIHNNNIKRLVKTKRIKRRTLVEIVD